MRVCGQVAVLDPILVGGDHRFTRFAKTWMGKGVFYAHHPMYIHNYVHGIFITGTNRFLSEPCPR